MRTIKLIVIAVLGYWIYGMIQDSGGGSGGSRRRGAGRSPQGGARRDNRSDRGQVITGDGSGEAMDTANPDGGSSRHRVGRGVVQR